MKTKIAVILCLLFPFSLFCEDVNLKGYLSLWEKKETEVLPIAITKNIPINLTLKLPSSPQTIETQKFIYKTTQPYTLDMEITFYSIFPYEGPVYFSLQSKIKGDINIICGGYFNREDFEPFPVMFCSGYREDKIIGITLSRKPQ